MKKLTIGLILVLLAAGMAGCVGIPGVVNLMKGVSAQKVTAKPIDTAFEENLANFSINLFQKSVTDKQNSLISPLSVSQALAMTANGADGETLSQMEQVLGGIPIDDLNGYFLGYVQKLPSGGKTKFHIANSIWYRDDLRVQKDFLGVNAAYYHAEAYQSAFDDQTVNAINSWAKSNTEGMIDKLLDTIDNEDVMYLINAVTFDSKWANPYEKDDIHKDTFVDINGAKKTVDFMHSEEAKYLDDGKATGFIRPYSSGYSFVALLPNKDVSTAGYIQSLTGAGFLQTIQNAKECKVYVDLPKFTYDYAIQLKEPLIVLGMPDAFSNSADFAKMIAPTDNSVNISKVLHKTYISVDEEGTKAGAITLFTVMSNAPTMVDESVILNRPFLYAIIDNQTDLPIFLGTVMTIDQQ